MTESTEPRTEPLTAEEEARHRDLGSGFCAGCLGKWPCEVARLLDAARQSGPSRVLRDAFMASFDALDSDAINLPKGRYDELRALRTALSDDEDRPEGPDRLVWLIERGQPEGLDRPQWWGVSDSRTGAYSWVGSALSADQFATRAEAEAVIAGFNRPGHPFNARAVQHGFAQDLIAVPAALRSTRSEDEPGTLDETEIERRATAMEGWAADPTLHPATRWLSLSVALAILRGTHPSLARRLSDPTASEASDGSRTAAE